MELPPSLVDGEVCWKRPADLYEVGVATTSCRTSYVGGGGIMVCECDLAVLVTYLFITFAVICPQIAGIFCDPVNPLYPNDDYSRHEYRYVNSE